MKLLTIEKVGSQFTVDEKARPGSPPVGRGRTMLEALGDYVLNNQEHLDVHLEVAETAQAAENRRRARELKKR